MDDLKREYTLLFNGITDTIGELERTIAHLKVLQQKAEEFWVTNGDKPEEVAVKKGVPSDVVVVEAGSYTVIE